MKQSKILENLQIINRNLLTENIGLLKEILNNVDLKNDEQIETIKYLLETVKSLRKNNEKLTERLQIVLKEEHNETKI